MSKLMFSFAAALALASFGCKKKGGAAGEAVAKMEGFQKQMCECKDKACADKVNEDMTKWGTEMAKTASADKDAKPDPELAKKSADIMTKYTECMTKLMMAGAEPPKADPPKEEPPKEEPAAGSGEPAKEEPKKDEPAAEPAKAEPAKAEPAKAEPKKDDAKPDDKKAGGW